MHRKRCPVFVMMPLDTVYVRNTGNGTSTSDVQMPETLDTALDQIAQAKVQVCASTTHITRVACGQTCTSPHHSRNSSEVLDP